jgi:hypothetical protein
MAEKVITLPMAVAVAMESGITIVQGYDCVEP